MENYSYITLLSDDSFIFGIVLLQESLKRVNTQYPLEVLVTSNVSKPILNILEQLEIKYKIIEPIKFDKFVEHNKKINDQFAKNWVLTFSKFEIFRMTEYDKIIFLDADLYVLKNLDHLFEREHLTAALDGEYFNIWPNNPHFNAGLIVIEPNEDEYNKLIEFTNNYTITSEEECIADLEILNAYYKDWINQPELHLSKYYNVFAPYIEEEYVEDVRENAYFIHFIGRKPWRAFSKPAHETYSETFYNEVRAIILEKVNSLDWESAKKDIKLTIYSICKDEMANIEKFLKCFTVADYVCILDTGSTDGTWEYLLKALEEYPNLIIDQKIINPWRYDEARNASLKLVPKDTVMYFMMDLDEIIKDENWVELIKDKWDPTFQRGAYTYNRQVDPVSGAVVQQFVEYRIHSKNWHYKGIVHEQLINIVDTRQFFADECLVIPITVWHYPTNPNRSIYIELCERGVEEEPLNWLMHLQLAAEYEVHQLYDKAIVEYRRIIAELTTLSEPELGRCYSSLGRALALIDKQDEGLSVLNKGMKMYPTYGDLYFFAAEINYKRNNYQETYDLCQKGINNCKTSYWCTIVNYNSYFPYLLMGLSQFYMNNPILALGYITIAREKNSNEDTNKIFLEIINVITNGG